MFGPPVDLSFKDIHSVAGAQLAVPWIGQRPLRSNSKGKYLSRSLRLSYNAIADLTGLQHICEHFLAHPCRIGWLDLSFNKITCINPVVCELRELRVLYLHGNGIWELSEVDKLGELPHLQAITLHGNPIETNEKYRKHLISTLPQLKRMDFSGVTREERDLANFYHPCSNHGKATKRTQESPMTVTNS